MLKEHKRSVYSEAKSRLCILDHFNQGGWITALIEATNWFFWLTAACLSIRDPSQEKVLNSLPSSSEKTSKHFAHYTDYSPFFFMGKCTEREDRQANFLQMRCLNGRTRAREQGSLPRDFSGDSRLHMCAAPRFWFLTPATGLDRDIRSHTNIH